MLCKVILFLKSVDEILKCDHSYESYTEQYFPLVLFIMLYKVGLSVTIQMKATEQCLIL